ncbi:MAG TPA: hypothetical protein VNG32_00365 [Candidatus Dormibacteraeota bacterium]|nr:hypothetical protein [Candidatus Dormibacteraeota bacterium]
MTTKVKYIIVRDDDVLYKIDIESCLRNGGEIVYSWTTAHAVHHIIRYEDNDDPTVPDEDENGDDEDREP